MMTRRSWKWMPPKSSPPGPRGRHTHLTRYCGATREKPWFFVGAGNEPPRTPPAPRPAIYMRLCRRNCRKSRSLYFFRRVVHGPARRPVRRPVPPTHAVRGGATRRIMNSVFEVFPGARRGQAGPGAARPGAAGRGKARQGKARRGFCQMRGGKDSAGEIFTWARQGAARRGRAWPGTARPGWAWPGKARQGKARQGLHKHRGWHE